MNSIKNKFMPVLLLLAPILNAQEIEWQNTIGGNDMDIIAAVHQTTDGGYICGGSSKSDSSGDKSENNLGNYDYWVLKLDAYGDIQWQNTIGGIFDDQLFAIIQTSDGGFMCGGYSNSNISGDKTENTNGGYDYWVVKLDSAGNIQWQNTFGGSQDDLLSTLKQTSDGGYICGGSSESSISGDKTENGQGNHDYWIVKLDSSGTILWQNTIGGPNTDYLRSLIPTIDGGYFCGGASNSYSGGDKSEDSQGGYDYWVLKLDSTGTVLWQNTIGGNDLDDLASVIQTQDGGYFCGGSSRSGISGDKTENNLGQFDYWVLKLDTMGAVDWQNTIGGTDDDELFCVTQITAGEYICTGRSSSDISLDKSETSINSSFDFWILQLDETGAIIWQNTIGGNSSDVPVILEETAEGDYITGGISLSGISGDKNENCQGNHDYWIVKLDADFNLIKGKMFADLNSNNIHDAAEPVIPSKKVTEINTGNFTFTGLAGGYSLAVFDSGSYQANPDTSISYYTPSPLNHVVTFSSTDQVDSLNDFAFQPVGAFNDLCVNITPVTAFRSGFAAYYLINYSNLGTTTLNPTVVFYPDSNLNFVASNPSPASVTADSVVYQFGPLTPYQNGQIMIGVNVDFWVPFGTIINSEVVVMPVINDADPLCNQDNWEIATVASYDPNDILVNRNSLFDFELLSPPWLEYIIRFQNTGNAPAIYVRLDNKITDDLQLNTFEFVNSSHPCTVTYQAFDSLMKFTFSNIMLPSSAANEPASHGFVRYRIQPRDNLVAGDTIRNKAGIYFDYNAAVWTNTALTEIISSLGIASDPTAGALMVYPNPVVDELTIELNNAKPQHTIIELYSVVGRHIADVYHGDINQDRWKKTIDVSGLSGGMYFMKVNGRDFYTVRFIKH